jgi:response regulator RpfG family c-di-GMP phosphodiesterase
MITSATVLLACDDPFTSRMLDEEARRTQGVDLIAIEEGEDVAALAREICADAVICGTTVGFKDGLEICRALRADGRSARSLVLLLTTEGDRKTKAAAIQSGVDGFLTVPIDPEDVRAALLLTQRTRALRDRLKQLDARLRETGRHVDQVVTLLVSLIDAGRPGASVRGETAAHLARQVAERFGIPTPLVRELDIAARLHEIGNVVNPSATAQLDPEDAPADEGPAFALASRAVVSQLDWLSGPADVIGSMCENWDGTGLPDRLCKGQIPLRSRILRVVIDYLNGLEDPSIPDASCVMTNLRAHTGTLYDPLVVLHLQAEVGTQTDTEPMQSGSATQVHIGDLKEGMTLAADLYTSSGVKLLASRAVLSRSTLETIKRRHQVDPIVSGAWIQSD